MNDNTPPQHRSKSEMNIPILQDDHWFFDWRRELKKTLENIIVKIESLGQHQNEIRIELFKYIQRLEQLAAETHRIDKHLEHIDTRVVALEKRAETESAVHKADAGSYGRKIIDSIAGNIGGIIVVGVAALAYFLVKLYFKEAP